MLRRTKSVLAQAIDEIEVADLGLTKGLPHERGDLGSVLVVRHGSSTLAFGAGLSNAELTWLCSVLRGVLTA